MQLLHLKITKSKDERCHVVVTTKVVESSLNYYGNAHGGYLFTLCDQVSGLVVVSQGVDGVTLQSSINYLKAGRLGDVLTIHGECVHSGRTTRVSGCRYYQSRRGQCLQGNLYDVCYGSER